MHVELGRAIMTNYNWSLPTLPGCIFFTAILCSFLPSADAAWLSFLEQNALEQADSRHDYQLIIQHQHRLGEAYVVFSTTITNINAVDHMFLLKTFSIQLCRFGDDLTANSCLFYRYTKPVPEFYLSNQKNNPEVSGRTFEQKELVGRLKQELDNSYSVSLRSRFENIELGNCLCYVNSSFWWFTE